MDNQLSFQPFLSFRKPLKNQGDKVLISDAWNCKRFLIKREDLFEALSGSFAKKPLPKHLKSINESGMIDNMELSKEDAEKVRHWWARGWHPSLDYYLWSRCGHYCDEHDPTKKHRRETLESYLKAGGPPPRLKPKGASLALPEPQKPVWTVSLAEILLRRESVRRYVPKPISQEALSAVLWHGLSQVRYFRKRPIEDPTDYLKSMGSAFDFYLVIYNVDHVAPGAYYYDITEHTLTPTNCGNFRKEMFHILRYMPAPGTATCTLIMVADFAQYQWRYRHERALRHLYFESGRIAPKALVTAMRYNLGMLLTPAQIDSKTVELLNIDPIRQCPIYTLTMGLDEKLLACT